MSQNNLMQKSFLSYIEQNASIEGNSMYQYASAVVTSGGTSSLVCTGLQVGADAMIGHLVRVEGGSTNTFSGEERLIIDNGSTGTIVVHPAFSASVSAGTALRFFSKHGDPVFVCNSDSGSTTAEDSTRADTVSQWVGAYLLAHNSGSVTAGGHGLISASTAAGTVTCGSLGGSTQAGDLFFLRRLAYVEDMNLQLTEEAHQRPVMRNNFGKLPSVMAGRGGKLSFKFEATPLVSRATDGVAATRPPFGRLLEKGLGGEQLETGDLLASGAGGTSWTLTDNDTFYANSKLGMAIGFHGDLRWITAHTSSTAVYTVNTGANLAVVGTALGTANYYLDESSSSKQGPVFFDLFYDGVRYFLSNCMMDSCKLTVEQGSRPMFEVSFVVDYWRVDEDTPWVNSSDFTNIQPLPTYQAQVIIDGVGKYGTLVATSAVIDVGMEVQPVPDFNTITGRKGFIRTSRNPTAQIKLQLRDDDYINLWHPGAKLDVIVQNGVDTKGGMGVHFMGVITNVEAPQNENGVLYQTLSFDIVEHGTSGVPDLVFSFY